MSGVLRDSSQGIFPFGTHQGMSGTLDAFGQASATVTFAPQEIPASMIGRVLSIAVITGQGGQALKSSIAVDLEFRP